MLAHLSGPDVGDVDGSTEGLVNRGNAGGYVGIVGTDDEAIGVSEGFERRTEAEELRDICDLEPTAEFLGDLFASADWNLGGDHDDEAGGRSRAYFLNGLPNGA
jgi:hypothetical protein